MVRILFAAIVTTVFMQSCCFVRPTHAQSDRFDTHRPLVPVIECIPCSTTRNSPELNLWSEAWGASGKWMVGIEPGYNANYFRVFADAGTYLWPSGPMKSSFREQIGIAPLDPDLFARPEIGYGLQQRYYRDGFLITSPAGNSFIEKQPDLLWQTFAGIRFNIPYSNMVLSARMYRMQNFHDNSHDWNFGLQFACRL